jgi:uncharacterized protein YjbI with pentapeptide repeats
VIDRLRRLIFGDVRVEVREVEGPDLPDETRVTEDLENVRFVPPTPNVVLDHVTMRGVDFSGLRFLWLLADDCRFIGCDFSRVRVERLPFASGGSLFRDCRFDGASIGDFGNVRLERCHFVDTDLEGWFTFAADIVDCRFAGRLTGVVFNGEDDTGRRKNEFRGNDFREADLEDVAFRFGIDLDQQRLPQGPEYVRLRNLAACIETVRADVTDSPEALQMLDLVGEVYIGEEDVFAKRAFVVDLADSPEVGERVVDLLLQASSNEAQND